jgi:hypothetical protein
MATGNRGPLLTTFAILFALLAVSNLLKPFQLEGPTTGFVFLGQRMCSGRQGHSPVGESPTVPVARLRHVAIPQFLGVTPGSLRGVNGPAALKTWSFSGGGNLGA